MATIGYTSIGAGTYQAGTALGGANPGALLITMPSAGTISKITAYVAMSTGTRSNTCAIRAGSAGSRGAVLSTTTATSVTTTDGWFDFTFTTPYTASATTYWLEYSGYGGEGPGSPFAQFHFDTGGVTNAGYTTLDNGTASFDSNQYSIYATYTASTGRPTASGRLTATGRLAAGTRRSATGRLNV